MPFPTNTGTVNLGPNALSAAIVKKDANKGAVTVKVKRSKKSYDVLALAKQVHYRGQAPSQNFIYRALNTFQRIMATVTPPRVFTSNPLETATTKLHQHALHLVKKPDGIRDDAAVEQTGADLQEVQELVQKPKVVSLLDMFSSLLKTATVRLPVKAARYEKAVQQLTDPAEKDVFKKTSIIYEPPPPLPKPKPAIDEDADVLFSPPRLNDFGALSARVKEVQAMGDAAKRKDTALRKTAANSYKALKVGLKTTPAGKAWLNEVARTLMKQTAYDVELGVYQG